MNQNCNTVTNYSQFWGGNSAFTVDGCPKPGCAPNTTTKIRRSNNHCHQPHKGYGVLRSLRFIAEPCDGSYIDSSCVEMNVLVHPKSENAWTMRSSECEEIMRIDNQNKQVVFGHTITPNPTQPLIGSLTPASGINNPSQTYLRTLYVGGDPSTQETFSCYRFRVDTSTGIMYLEQKIANEVPSSLQLDPDAGQAELDAAGYNVNIGTWSALQEYQGPAALGTAGFPDTLPIE